MKLNVFLDIESHCFYTSGIMALVPTQKGFEIYLMGANQ